MPQTCQKTARESSRRIQRETDCSERVSEWGRGSGRTQLDAGSSSHPPSCSWPQLFFFLPTAQSAGKPLVSMYLTDACVSLMYLTIFAIYIQPAIHVSLPISAVCLTYDAIRKVHPICERPQPVPFLSIPVSFLVSISGPDDDRARGSAGPGPGRAEPEN